MCDATHHTRVRAVNWNFRRQHTLATKKKRNRRQHRKKVADEVPTETVLCQHKIRKRRGGNTHRRTNEEWSTPALSPPVADAYAFASSSPSPRGSLSGCTASKVGTPKPRLYSSRTSVPGHLGATIITVMSGRICIPSSTMLKPCEYARVDASFIIGLFSGGVCRVV